LEQALKQGPIGTDEYDYEVWVEYSKVAINWSKIMTDMRLVVSGLDISFEAAEPGVIFTQAPGQI